MSQWMLVKEAAEHYKAHPETVRRWVRSGEIPARKIGAKWRIWVDDTPWQQSEKENNK